MSLKSHTSRLAAALLGGAVAFLAGILAARTWLPEWRGEPLPEESRFVERFEAAARSAGVRLAPGEPRVQLVNVSGQSARDNRELDRLPHGLLQSSGWGARVRIGQEGTLPDDGKEPRALTLEISPAGEVKALHWASQGLGMFFRIDHPPASRQRQESFARLLLAPGESLGGLRETSVSGNPGFLAEIRGSSPPEYLQIVAQAGGNVYIDRHPGGLQDGLRRAEDLNPFRILWRASPEILRFLGVLALFVVLTATGRIDVINAAFLTLLALAASLAPGLLGRHLGADPVAALLAAGSRAVWVFVVWSAGESFLRAVDPGFTTSLDSLRAGRLGPRGGRSLLYGLALGGLLAGLLLALHALAVALPDAWPESVSVRLPVFDTNANPFGKGMSLAGVLVVVLAVCRRLVPPRWVPAAAALAGAFLAGPLRLHPVPLELAGNLAAAGLLVLLGQRFGLTALLTAAIAAYLLPAAAFSASRLEWMPYTFGFTAGSSAALLLLGLAGLRRPEQVEMERLRPPAFIRRLEEERRIRYEMDLLARMQIGLLPAHLPAIDGWQVAARSLLATEAGGDLYDFLPDEAGRLWVAVGDVAGHGYSCAIVQAMTTAALSSLVSLERTPGEVLGRVDRVLRRGGHRNFASLVLLRLDPETGEALLSNAGHPYPLALSNGEVAELEVPGLPLGQGPPRTYRDVALAIPPGGALVFCSDGLFEAVDWSSSPYGFDRPQEVLRTLENRTAEEILDILMRDWQRHLRSEQPPDDTTVVVLKRLASGS